MAELSGIEWTDSTFNPWIGCTKISPACDNCYAADWSKRYNGPEWGNHPRRRTKTWGQPRKWQRQADEWEAVHGRPRFVFCASLADVFDNQVAPEWRDDLWRLIKECDRLVWLLLTKRPQNIAGMLPPDWGDGYPNVWLGTTVENQEVADKNVPHLLSVPAAKRFLSIEPIVGPIDLYRGGFSFLHNLRSPGGRQIPAVNWVIAGGESGVNARPAPAAWYRSLRDQCAEAGVAFHFKQWGEWHPWEQTMADGAKNYVSKGKRPEKYTEEFGAPIVRVGKKAAGRFLDGRTWDERPTPAPSE